MNNEIQIRYEQNIKYFTTEQGARRKIEYIYLRIILCKRFNMDRNVFFILLFLNGTICSLNIFS